MTVEFFVGMTLGIGDECIGTVTEVTDARLFIDSPCFRGWATKAEIAEAIASATEAPRPHTPPQRPSFAA